MAGMLMGDEKLMSEVFQICLAEVLNVGFDVAWIFQHAMSDMVSEDELVDR